MEFCREPKKEKADALQISWERIFHSLNDAIMFLDLDNKIVKCNHAMATLAGLPMEQMLGKQCSDIVHGKTRAPFDCTLKGVRQTKMREIAKQWVQGKWFNVVVDPVFDDSGNLVGAVHLMYDVTAHEILRTEDALTGLYNRIFFERKLAVIRRGQACGIILCDIDGLKLINETFGFEAGDTLLVEVAGILRKALKPEVIIARVGEDTFGVLFPDCSETEVVQACRGIHRTVDAFNATKGYHFLSLSLGRAFTGNLTDTPHKLLSQAYDAIRRKKMLSTRSSVSVTAMTVEKLLKARDMNTGQHSDRSQELAAQLAENFGLPDSSVDSLRLLGQFHDIGKIGVSDSILLKADRLTVDEYQLMTKHCEIGYYIALSLPDIAHIAEWILKHHERWDGKGYPLKIESEQIPIECRIMSIVDAYDAMTNDRPYRKSMSHDDAIKEIRRCAGTQFDPVLSEKFIELVTGGLSCNQRKNQTIS